MKTVTQLLTMFDQVNKDTTPVPYSDILYYADQLCAIFEDDGLDYDTAIDLAKQIEKAAHIRTAAYLEHYKPTYTALLKSIQLYSFDEDILDSLQDLLSLICAPK